MATFDAIVGAGARLLAAGGYGALTTNHVAAQAGVSVGSLYEYFPGKDAIVAEVAARLVDRVLAALSDVFPKVLAEAPPVRMRSFVDAIFHTLLRERPLVAVFVTDVPFTRELPAVRAITGRLLELSRSLGRAVGVSLEDETANLYLINNLVSSTILGLVLDPPPDVSVEAVLDALARRISRWVGGTDFG